MFLLFPLTFTTVIAYLLFMWIYNHRRKPLRPDPRDDFYPDLENDPDYQASLKATQLQSRSAR